MRKPLEKVLQALSIWKCCSCVFNKIIYLTDCECQGGSSEVGGMGWFVCCSYTGETKMRGEICKC